VARFSGYGSVKVVFYLHSLSRGGAERVATTLANYWAQNGRDVAIVTVARPIEDFYSIHPAVRRYSLLERGGRPDGSSGVLATLDRIRLLRTLLRELRPDVVISLMNTANVVLALAGIGMRRIVRLGSERSYPPAVPMSRAWNALRYWSYRYLDAVVAQSSQSASWIRRNTRARSVPVIPNPISLPLPSHVPRVLPESVQGAGALRLLAVGRLEREKGFDLLLEAFSRIAEECGKWKLFIVGDGSLKNELGGMIQALRLDGRVFLVGPVGNPADWYSSSDLFVLSSRFEGFPNALLEALSHGVPAVSFDCDTGPREILRPGLDGLLVPGEDVDGLAAGMRRLMTDTAFRSSCASNARQAGERFSVVSVGAMWDEVVKGYR
jgi:glycosyltransferase involved in cell wall biosynthesis